MKIYTRTGDDGTTGLIGGDRIAKNSLRISAIGAVDELNALVGWARALGEWELDAEMQWIQNLLFDLGAELASPKEHARQHRAIDESKIERLELSIDRQTERLEPLRNFILPGGSELAARIHIARGACRRAERSILELNEHEAVSHEAMSFVNRLSDWLFVAARTANQVAGVMDVKWSATGE